MRFYLGVTDTGWFRFLRSLQPEDVNYWQPSGRVLKGLERGEPFLFKLKAPYRKIGGVGFFSAFASYPLNVAWDAFGIRNGCITKAELQRKITQYRGKNRVVPDLANIIGCIILTDPVFFADDEMIDLPSDWDDHTVTGKFYSVKEGIGKSIWDEVILRLQARRFLDHEPAAAIEISATAEPAWRQVAAKIRIGQGAFRCMVTEAYHRACAITGDHTLPVLEAAHIRPYAESGPNLISNGLLLRADLHRLFDDGYLTVTPDFHVEISKSIREEFHNGKVYYQLHGSSLMALPDRKTEMPARDFLAWHNEKVFKAG